MEPNQLDLHTAITTTRAMRRLRPDPVPPAVLHQLVEAATCGPTGSFRQNWRFHVVTDRAVMADLGRLWGGLQAVVEAHTEQVLPDAIARSVRHLGEHFAAVPAVVFVGGVDAPRPEDPPVVHATFYGSLFPAAQNLMLAARGFGLGTTLTTLLVAVEDQVKALVGIPDDVRLAAAIPVGYPEGTFARPTRNPVEEVAFLDGVPFRPPAAG